jgi:hypothetical protein
MRQIFQLIAAVGDRQLVPWAQHTPIDPSAVDPGAVGAPQVADQDAVAVEDQATVAPRDPGRGDPDMALALPAHHDHGPVELDIRMAVQADQV